MRKYASMSLAVLALAAMLTLPALPALAVGCSTTNIAHTGVDVNPSNHDLNGVQANIQARDADQLCASGGTYGKDTVQYVMLFDSVTGAYVQVGYYWRNDISTTNHGRYWWEWTNELGTTEHGTQGSFTTGDTHAFKIIISGGDITPEVDGTVPDCNGSGFCPDINPYSDYQNPGGEFSGEAHQTEEDITGNSSFRTNYSSMLTEYSGSGWATNAFTATFDGCSFPSSDKYYHLQTFTADYSKFKDWTDRSGSSSC